MPRETERERLLLSEERIRDIHQHVNTLNDEHSELVKRAQKLEIRMESIESSLRLNTRITFIILVGMVGVLFKLLTSHSI